MDYIYCAFFVTDGITSAWVILATATAKNSKSHKWFQRYFLIQEDIFCPVPRWIIWDRGRYFNFLCFNTILCWERFVFVSQHVTGWKINVHFIVCSETKIGVESAHTCKSNRNLWKSACNELKVSGVIFTMDHF